MFVDSSAIVATPCRGREADAFADLLEGAPSPITLPIALFEEDFSKTDIEPAIPSR